MKIQSMRCNAGVSEVVGTVLLLGITITCATLVWLFVVPEAQTYATSLTPHRLPEIWGTIEDSAVVLEHEGGNPITTWHLILNSNNTQQGSNFTIGTIIRAPVNTTQENSVMLIDDENNLVAFDYVFPPLSSFVPENQEPELPEENPYMNITRWTNHGGASGGSTQIGDCLEFFDNLTSEYYWWQTPLNHTGSVHLNITIREFNVTDAWSFFAVGISSTDRSEYLGCMKSMKNEYGDNGYFYTSADNDYNPYTIYNGWRNRTWSITLNETTHRASYSVHEGSTCLWSALDKDYAYNFHGGEPEYLFIYTSGYRKCRVLVSDIEVS